MTGSTTWWLRTIEIIRLPDIPAAAQIAVITDLLQRHGHERPGSIVTVRGGRIRISRARGEA